MKITIHPTRLIKKSMVGRPGDFLAFDGEVYSGCLTSVKNGIAEFIYYIPCKGEFRTLLGVRDRRLEMHL